MGLFKSISRLGQRLLGEYRVDAPHARIKKLRICRFEEIESRRLMTVAPVHVGAVYYDPASGLDHDPNVISITFEGGAAGTELTHLTIDGNKDGGGLNFNDAIFDTSPSGLGAYGSSPLKIAKHDGFQVTGQHVDDGGTVLTMDFKGFKAGMTLVLTVDVDQVLFIGTGPAQGDVEVDAVDEGAEFQRSKFITTFTAPHYEDLTTSTLFWDKYDPNFANADKQAGTTLNLPHDKYSDPTKDQIVLTAGAVAVAPQPPKPNSLSGVVYVDNNLNNHQDTGDLGLAGVSLTLYQLNGNNYVSTGKTAVTDSQGRYEFDNLAIGTYSVHETQPNGYFSVGATPGTVNGQTRGIVVNPDELSQAQLLGGENSIRNDFAEALPNSISGHVGNDVTGDCETNPNTPGIAGVVMHLLDATGKEVATTKTDVNGDYRFDNLRAGVYTVHEDQPAGWLQDDFHIGSAGGVKSAIDTVSDIRLTTNIHGVHYDYCEVLPVSISGMVRSTMTGDCDTDPNAMPIEGVVIELLDGTGQVIDTTKTDAAGKYSFTNLPPGTYGVHEIQPAGYFDGDTEAGDHGGTVGDDIITKVTLLSGVQAHDYDFCEYPPASLCGYVYLDANNNGHKDAGEAGIAGVTLILKDANGNPTGARAVTAADGSYCFLNLPPGTYGVDEIQPEGYLDGIDEPGTAGGEAHNPGDSITGAILTAGFMAKDYDFGEILPASISGIVRSTTTGDCDTDPNAKPLAGVVIHLLNNNGAVIATTTTDVNGQYAFTNLIPGTYSVVEDQPEGYFDGDVDVGSQGGTPGINKIVDVLLPPGANGVQYNFCEMPPAMLSGYVFQDGPPIDVGAPGDIPDIKALRDGKLTADDTLLPGVTLMLVDGVTGQPIFGSAALPGYYNPNQPITTVTDAGGHYQFAGLAAGVYGVYDVTPAGYLRAIDTAGSMGGDVVSPYSVIDPAIVAQLQVQPHDDAIVRIGLMSGDNSINNNFSVVVTAPPGVFPFPQPIVIPPINPPGPAVPVFVIPPPVLPQNPFLIAPQLTRAAGALYTWHLSIVDAGLPRTLESSQSVAMLVSMRPDEDAPWSYSDLTEGEFLLPATALRKGKLASRRLKFGMQGGTPIAGDFNGDGKFEVGMFKDGHWYIDLNDNGVWDEGDLWAKLGHHGDRPVTGDWDGDGKTDIGIYGPAWRGDPRAIRHEPGIPDPYNENTAVHKNIPRPPEKTTVGRRKLQLTAAGKQRTDVIDHVFLYGTPGDHPIVGDWNGDGTATIAVFRNGVWHRDTDGDGKSSDNDLKATFGQPGDIPVVGDFNGDGVDDLGVYRDGTWYIDTNGNGVIDADDEVFELGGAGDKPIVGDWDGDGKAEPGVYHQAAGKLKRAGND